VDIYTILNSAYEDTSNKLSTETPGYKLIAMINEMQLVKYDVKGSVVIPTSVIWNNRFAERDSLQYTNFNSSPNVVQNLLSKSIKSRLDRRQLKLSTGGVQNDDTLIQNIVWSKVADLLDLNSRHNLLLALLLRPIDITNTPINRRYRPLLFPIPLKDDCNNKESLLLDLKPAYSLASKNEIPWGFDPFHQSVLEYKSIGNSRSIVYNNQRIDLGIIPSTKLLPNEVSEVNGRVSATKQLQDIR
jgi:hypothetical protein